MDDVILLFEGAAETGKIKRSALKNWLVRSLIAILHKVFQFYRV